MEIYQQKKLYDKAKDEPIHLVKSFEDRKPVNPYELFSRFAVTLCGKELHCNTLATVTKFVKEKHLPGLCGHCKAVVKARVDAAKATRQAQTVDQSAPHGPQSGSCAEPLLPRW